MKRTIGNFLGQSNKDFPADCETLAYLQDNINLLALLGVVIGDKTVLQGCELINAGTQRTPGYVYVCTKDYPNGEILYWEGGSATAGIILNVEPIAVTDRGYTYPQAYTSRSLIAGVGDESYHWSDFKNLKTVHQLEDALAAQKTEIAAIKPAPLGVVHIWGGRVSAGYIPEGYMLCDGRELEKTAYKELYDVISTLHSPPTTQQGYFCLPDLRSQFIVGYDNRDPNYDVLAKKGGQKAVTLTAEQMPEHVHKVKDYYHAEVDKGQGSADKLTYNVFGSAKSDWDNNKVSYIEHDSYKTGGSQSHENRPPFYTMAYIIRVK